VLEVIVAVFKEKFASSVFFYFIALAAAINAAIS